MSDLTDPIYIPTSVLEMSPRYPDTGSRLLADRSSNPPVCAGATGSFVRHHLAEDVDRSTGVFTRGRGRRTTG